MPTSRRLVFSLCALAAVAHLPLATHAQTKRVVTDEEVMRVHKSALLIDTHNDVTSSTVTGLDFSKRREQGHTDLPRLQQGGVGATFFAVYVAANYTNGNHSANRTLQMIDTVRNDIVGKNPDALELVTTADGIVAAHKEGKIAALMGIEGGHAIEDSLRLLRDYYLLGVRYMTLTHSNSNHWADSSGDANKPNNGLSPFGKQVVGEMNRLGIMVDISHVADKTFWDALEVSKAPIFASHSSCRALSDVPRNMTDDMIVALAKKNGVVQINFSCDFLNPESARTAALTPEMQAQMRQLQADMANKSPDELRQALAKIRAGRPPMHRATIDDVVKHIDHVVKIAGIDHVGIGSDFDGVECTPEGLDDVSKFPNLTRKLLEAGYTAPDIRKIYGENLLRVMRDVEKVSAELRKIDPTGPSEPAPGISGPGTKVNR
jgi:membrane dipeptidase